MTEPVEHNEFGIRPERRAEIEAMSSLDLVRTVILAQDEAQHAKYCIERQTGISYERFLIGMRKLLETAP